MLVFPAVLTEYFFAVDGQVTSVAVPADFNFNKLIRDTFFPKASSGRLEVVLGEIGRKTPSASRSTVPVTLRGQPGVASVIWLPLGKKVKKGDPILNFDILTGDLLFVDRFTYNFFPPKVGQGFVFKTENIHSPNMRDRNTGEQIAQYYIKRLVGEPGDKLEVRKPKDLITDGAPVDLTNAEGQLFRNGAPISGADAFGKNSRKEGLYPGYTAAGNLSYGEVLTIPGKSYFAMGDNSPDSSDGRFWGFVPEKDVVGRPLFIYYPLTSRWGPAR